MHAQEIIGVLLPLTAVCSYINYKFVKLPKSIGITLVALVITVIVNSFDLLGWPVAEFAQTLVDNIGFDETFLHGMLSFLLFAGALHINTVELSKYKFIIAVFATISVLISAFIIGYATYFITKMLGIDLPFYYCFVFGALISPTDAVTVIGILRTAKIPKSIEMKIAGEALFNDGMGIVLYFMALGLALGVKRNLDTSEILLYFFREGFGGLIFGALMGWFASKLLNTIDEYEQAIFLTLALVTGGYVLATSIMDVSGPICMATTGLIVGSSYRANCKSRQALERMEIFWDLVDQLLNAILFVLIGLEFVRIEYSIQLIIASLLIILVTIGARWISIFVPVVLLEKFAKFNARTITIMTWAGLRGGISIALALSVTGHHHDIIVSITYFVVLFSIMIQGITMRPLANALSDTK